MRWYTRPVEILQAGLEAAAYRLAQIYELLSPQAAPDPLVIASGTALLESPVWQGIVASVLGRPVATTREGEATSRGATLLAAEVLLLSDAAAAPLELGVTREPDLQRHVRYREGLERHRRLYRKLLGRRSLMP